jgi:hypothetical protein
MALIAPTRLLPDSGTKAFFVVLADLGSARVAGSGQAAEVIALNRVKWRQKLVRSARRGGSVLVRDVAGTLDRITLRVASRACSVMSGRCRYDENGRLSLQGRQARSAINGFRVARA